jgi:hypothetical protein
MRAPRTPDRGRERAPWQPEPLHLPVEPPSTRAPAEDERTDREERTGSHVIVIELA